MAPAKLKSGLISLPAELQVSNFSDEPVTLTLIQYTDGESATSTAPLFVVKRKGKAVMIAELVRFTQPNGSWILVPENEQKVPYVCSNGNISLVTRVDPLFCALILMDAHRQVGGKDVFQPLDAVCITKDGTNLSRICPIEQFSLICDVKAAAGDSFYRLSDDKVLQWLLAKHQKLEATPQLNSNTAADILMQYLAPRWKKLFSSALKTNVSANPAPPDTHKASVDLAMSLMLDAAKEDSQTDDRLLRQKKRPAAPPKKSAAKKQQPPSAAAKNFWTSRKKTQSPANGAAKKRKRS